MATPHAAGFMLFGTMIPVAPEKESSAVTPEKKPEKAIPCPRCKSMETKFCYYNNYNVNQPRHFCKNCQRYWTAGGSLRNVPVGAGRRKHKPFHQQQVGFPEETTLFLACDQVTGAACDMGGARLLSFSRESEISFSRQVFSGER